MSGGSWKTRRKKKGGEAWGLKGKAKKFTHKAFCAFYRGKKKGHPGGQQAARKKRGRSLVEFLEKKKQIEPFIKVGGEGTPLAKEMKKRGEGRRGTSISWSLKRKRGGKGRKALPIRGNGGMQPPLG